MQQALDLADQAEAIGEVPVGALVDKIIGRGFNAPIDCDPCLHAEILLCGMRQKQYITIV